MKRASVVIGILVVLATACGKAPSTTGTAFTLRIVTAGGFLPPGADLTSVPEFALTADGRVVTAGAQIEIYPGPATPAMLQRSISDAGIAAIRDQARGAGLLGADAHYGNDTVADAGTTFFIATEDGVRHVVSAYALGIADQPGLSDNPEARAKLQKFREKIGDLASWLPAGSLGDEKTYEFDALRVVVRAATSGADDPTPNELEWPLAALATFGDAKGDVRCGVVSGTDLSTLRPRLSRATQITIWHSDGRDFNLQFRPQLPDELGCEVPGPEAQGS